MTVNEVNKDTFWTLIDQAKEQCGQDKDAMIDWLQEQLLTMEPRQSQNFHDIMHGYLDLARKYGLWNAALVMREKGCTDDSFMDFCAWLIGQGKEVYFAALKDPDSLADVQISGDCQFESLLYVGDMAYEKLTGRSAYSDTDHLGYELLKLELRKDIVYDKGIEYPYEWHEVAEYLPRLCAKHLKPDELRTLIARGKLWNARSSEIQRARKINSKSKKVGRKRGDAR